MYKSTFLPFHRLPALRPETSLDAKVIHYFFDHVAFNVGPPPAKIPKPSPPTTLSSFAVVNSPAAKASARVAREAPVTEYGLGTTFALGDTAQPAPAAAVVPSDGQFASSRTHPLEPVHHSIWDQVTGNRSALIVESAAVGGNGGQPWDDSAFVNKPIRAIRVNHGGGIDQIQVFLQIFL